MERSSGIVRVAGDDVFDSAVSTKTAGNTFVLAGSSVEEREDEKGVQSVVFIIESSSTSKSTSKHLNAGIYGDEIEKTHLDAFVILPLMSYIHRDFVPVVGLMVYRKNPN